TSADILDPRATGIAWGDYDNDGDLDLFLTQGRGYANSVISELTNFLYQNNGDGTFTEVGAAAGVSSSLNSHAATWADFDLDGDLDLYVSNSGTQTAGSQPNFLYKNLGNGTFTDVAPLVGATGSTVDVSGGIAVGDVNADGFLDIVIVHGVPTFEMFPGANEVLLNEGNGTHWLQIKLVGKKSNRLGIGARVELTAPDGLYQMREMNGGIHNFSQDEMLLTFGLGWRTSISQLTIYWPSGIVQVITNLSVNKRIEISECAPCSLPPPNQPNNTPSR
ncbi:MAG: CRTAC1 family protein, partial [Anaerolineales bacterium]